MGTANTTVLDGVGPSPSIVCSVLNCMAPGDAAIVLAASARLKAAILSPSALVMVARFSLSAEACLAIIFLSSSGTSTSKILIAVTLRPQFSACFWMMASISSPIFLPFGQKIVKRHPADNVPQGGLRVL